MNKNISIVLAVLFAFAGGFNWASAQTTEATSATEVVPASGIAIDEPGAQKPKPTPYQTREQMEARTKAPRQTQGTSFGEKARLGATTTAAMKANREEMEKRAKEMRADVEKKRATIMDEQKKKRLEIARKQTELINKRLEQAIARVQKLSDRVAERLTKLEAEGVTTTVSRGHLAEAKTKLDEARAKAAGVKVAIETAFAGAIATASSTPGTAPKNAMKEVQGAVKEVAKLIQEAHKHVALAISTVKPGLNKPRTATTTPTTTAPATTSATTTQ